MEVFKILFLMLALCKLVLGDVIHIVSGVVWSEIKNVYLYEASVPLIYISQFTNDTIFESRRYAYRRLCVANRTSSVTCQAARLLNQLNHQYTATCDKLENSLEQDEMVANGLSRIPRALDFLGDALKNWCCGVLSTHSAEPIFKNEEQIKKVIDNLNFNSDLEHSELIKVTEAMKAYTNNLDSVLADQNSLINSIVKHLDNLENSIVKHNELEFKEIFEFIIEESFKQIQTIRVLSKLLILEHCKSHKIPAQIISPENLKTDLNRLQLVLEKKEYNLVIPAIKASEYAKLEIAECMIDQSQIVVKVKVPIRKATSQAKLYKLVCIPFFWNNHTCSICNDEILVVRGKDRTRVISGPALEFCKPSKSRLCYVPRSSVSTVLSGKCVQGLVAGDTVSQLSKFCTFKCAKHENLLVNQIEFETFIITNAVGHFQVKCPNSNYEFPATFQLQPGALEIKLPCACELSLNAEIIINRSFPCGSNSIQNYTIKHLLPAFWTKLEFLRLPEFRTHTSLTFDNFSQITLKNWTEVSPELHVAPVPLVNRENVIDLQHLAVPRNSHFSFLRLLNTASTVLVFLVILRNPYLVGLGNFPVARGSNEVHEMLSYVCNGFVILILICFMIYLYFYWIKQKNNRRQHDTSLEEAPKVASRVKTNK